jgi:hypothetical protein
MTNKALPYRYTEYASSQHLLAGRRGRESCILDES